MSTVSKAQTIKRNEESASLQPAGHLLGKFGIIALAIILLVAAWFNQVIIVAISGLVLSTAGLAKLWSWCTLKGVYCQRYLSEQRTFPGEYIELKLQLDNRKPLPLPWVQINDVIPSGLALTDVSSATESGYGDQSLNNTASLSWYTRISWRYRLHCKKRGYYPLGPLVATSGDIFGFYPRSKTQSFKEHVIVYPKLYSLTQLGLPSVSPLGETKAKRHIFEDQTYPIGVRDYRPSDSLKHIHWKASARHQNLKVKVFEPTTTLKVIIFIAVDSFLNGKSDGEEDFELGISTAASIANYIAQQRSQVGLFANTLLPDSGQPARIPIGSAPEQLVNILETLAKINPVPSSTFEEFLQGEQSSLPWGSTIVLVISEPPQSLPELTTNLNKVGHKPVIIQVSEHQHNGTHCKATWYNIRHPNELMKPVSKESK